MDGIVNVEEEFGKIVGKRLAPTDPFAYAMDLQKTGNALGRSLKTKFVPKGVFRFNSHEEADEWMIRMMASRNANRAAS